MKSSIDILSEQVLRIILGGNTTSDKELKKDDVRIYVSQALGTVIRRRFFENKIEGDEYVDGSFIYAFEDVEVKLDTKKKLYYVDLPATTIDLPNGIGIFSIGYMENQENTFVPVTNAFQSLFRGLKSYAMGGRVSFYKEQKKIYFVNMENGIPCKVLVKIVAPFGDLDKCNSFDVPLDMQEEIVRMAVQLYMIQAQNPKDIENNNVK